MKIGHHTLHPHSMCVHFTTALFPAALFFLVLSFYYHPEFSRFAYYHLMILAVVSVPVSHMTGTAEWKQTYRGYRTRTFTRKIRCSIAAGVLGLLCILWYGLAPHIVNESGVLRILFLACNAAILPLVLYLGHLGGKLVFGGAH